MNEATRKELLEILLKAVKILERKDEREIEELKELSDQAVEGVALHKDMDLISVTVLVYSLYKIIRSIPAEDYQEILEEMQSAQGHLAGNNLGKYNKNIKSLFELVRKSDARIKEHLQDVLHAARIKKGMVLLQKGLSLGQAAGLMGLSNWDLQPYAGRSLALEQHRESIPAKKRLGTALEIFNLS